MKKISTMYYTKINTKTMDGLNPAERGLYQYMKAQHENYRFYPRVMANELESSEYLIRKLLRSLINKGVIQRIQQRIKGFINYIYKVFDNKVEVRDDIVLTSKGYSSKGTKEEVKEEIKQEVKEEIKEEIKQEVKEEKKEWRELFKGNEDLIEKFMAIRKKHLNSTTYYKNRGTEILDIEVERHIEIKINEKNSIMAGTIKEFIKTEVDKKKLHASTEVTEEQLLKGKMAEEIFQKKLALSQERFPEHWAKKGEGISMSWSRKKMELELQLSTEFEEIKKECAAKYEELIKNIK